MPTRSLPIRPSLEQLKIQAKELRRAHRDRQASAAARIAAHHPRFRGAPPRSALDADFALADAQLVIAREYGFSTWTQIKARVELASRIESIAPHPRFAEALAALDAGDLEALARLIASDPALVHARTNLDPPYGYFAGATLLHHVAGNPDRDRLSGARPALPQNSAALARLLLDAGADVNAVTLGPNGGDTMGLVLTSKQASDADLSGPLIDVLFEHGAALDLTSDNALDSSLANHAPRAADKLIALGAKPDVLAAAALGRLDLLRGFFDDGGRLSSRPRRGGKEMTDRDAIGLALLYSYVREQREAVDFLLEKDGNWEMTGVNNGAVLHRAAIAGDLDMVRRLVARGASLSNRDNPFSSTPLGWADHGRQIEVVRWMVEHATIDLHDAVAFGLRAQVDARLRDDPASLNARIDQWDIPQGTPLHWAADQNRVELAELLIAKGADVNAIAGNGCTPLDVADYMKATAAIELLERLGGVRAIAAKGTTAAAPAVAPAIDASREPYEIDPERHAIRIRGPVTDADWARIVAIIAERQITRLDAAWSKDLTDERVAALASCDHLERVDLLGTSTGDGAVRALSGKKRLRHLKTGTGVTEQGLELFREFPALTTWQHGAIDYGLMRFDADPTFLLVQAREPFGRQSLRTLAGLGGLFGLNLDNPVWKDVDLAPLLDLPHLGWLGHDATDESMPQIAALPRLRFLMCQDTEAGDEGFTALSRSQTIEHIWGRRCYNLGDRGFAALATMPALRGLAVSCRNVSDEALAALPRFPALRDLMPMDVSDAGFRHVGRCEHLETLWCMYCRDITDAATGQIAGLSKLKTYYAGQTQISDRSLDILAHMPSLETITLDHCAGVTNAGITRLAGLPRLRDLTVDGCAQVTADALSAFAASVHVRLA